MATTETKILVASDDNVLSDHIDYYSADGWKLVGPVSASADPFARAMMFVATLQRVTGEKDERR